jgi:S-adenosylmethionine:tRNA ribosyltransferase-isomerase
VGDRSHHQSADVELDATRSRRDARPIDEFDYGLPAEAIAQAPVEPRSAARLLVGPGLTADGSLAHSRVADLPALLRPGDVVVFNDTRVLAARLRLRKGSGGQVELLLLEPDDPGDRRNRAGALWSALVRPSRRLADGTLLFETDPNDPNGTADRGPVVEIGARLGDGRRRVRLLDDTVIERAGMVPLPPYFHGNLDDPDRYQTVYARARSAGERSSAAPTAGLHFTRELLDACQSAGARFERVDLSIGTDTFRPITASTIDAHVMHSERYTVPESTLTACETAERVVAVGTTTVRALESAAATGNLSGRTELYIRGDFPFRVVDVLMTNFHQPRSSLLVLVDAFAGPVWRDLYANALAERYRFLSFGDAMIVGRRGDRAKKERDG